MTPDTVDGREFVFKVRHKLSWLLIPPGNFVFRWRMVSVRVLTNRQWKAWERTVVPFDLPDKEASPGTLAMANVHGRPLAQLLNEEQRKPQKLALVSEAVSALHQFHQQVREVPDFGAIRLSHGDATTRNVMIDADARKATWFDFDLRHDLTISATMRHADDLRAILFSAAHYFPAQDLPDLVHVARQAYDEPKTWLELTRQVNSRWFSVDLFHLAHTRPPSSTSDQPSSQGADRAKERILIRTIGES